MSDINGFYCVDDTFNTSNPDHGMGYAGRDLDKYPLGGLKCARLVSKPAIDPKLFKQIIKDKDAAKSWVTDESDRKGRKRKNQQQTNFCTTADTEILTDKGWKSWPDYNGEDLLGTMNVSTGILEFQSPTATQVFEHDGEMIYGVGERIDFGVTPNHRMLLKKWDESKRTLSDHFSFQLAKDIGWYAGLPHSTTGYRGVELKTLAIPGDRSYCGDDLLALLSVVVSDGYAGATENTKNWVSFCCFRPDRYDMVASLASRVGFKEHPSRKGCWTRYDAGALAEWVRCNCYVGNTYKSHQKKIPDIVKVACVRQIEHFLKFYGDQSHDDGQKSFCSTSKRAIDDLQELHLRIGKRGTIWKPSVPKKSVLENGQVINSVHPVYSLGISKTDRLCINRKNNIEKDNYKGLVYCATVPNGTLVTRRNGSVLISGNCWGNAPAGGVELCILMEGGGVLDISAAFACSQINGGRNAGGSGVEWVEWVAKNGCCTSGFWQTNLVSGRSPDANTKANALKHKIELQNEFDPGDYDSIYASVLADEPVTIGIPSMGHEMLITRLTIGSDGRIRPITDNSWGDEWGTNGRCVLDGAKLRWDEAAAIVAVSVSLT